MCSAASSNCPKRLAASETAKFSTAIFKDDTCVGACGSVPLDEAAVAAISGDSENIYYEYAQTRADFGAATIDDNSCCPGFSLKCLTSSEAEDCGSAAVSKHCVLDSDDQMINQECFAAKCSSANTLATCEDNCLCEWNPGAASHSWRFFSQIVGFGREHVARGSAPDVAWQSMAALGGSLRAGWLGRTAGH